MVLLLQGSVLHMGYPCLIITIIGIIFITFTGIHATHLLSLLYTLAILNTEYDITGVRAAHGPPRAGRPASLPGLRAGL